MNKLKENNEVLKIDDMEVINELLQGRTLDIIIELMDNELTEEQLLNRLDMYPMKLKYYILKLEKFQIIECIKEEVVKQKIKYLYKLKKDNLDMFVNLPGESKIGFEMLSNLSKYQDMLKRGFKEITKNPELTNKQGVVFIHTSEEKAKEFKNQLNELIQKFISIEDKTKNNGYLFLPMLFPYEMRDEKND